MSKLYSYMYMSVDGVVESPEKWVSPFVSDEMGEDLSRRLQSAAAMVLGGVTYTEFAAFWPRQADDFPFAGINNRIAKLVVSRHHQSTVAEHYVSMRTTCWPAGPAARAIYTSRAAELWCATGSCAA